MRTEKPRILVVEDDTGLRDLMRIHLTLAGYDVHTAHNGKEALTRILELNPAALVLDLNMPKIDGFAVLEAMARHPATKAIPSLVVSARNAPDDIKRAVKAGAKDYLSKPFTEAQLTSRVARLMRWVAPPAQDSSVLI